jgi:AcrR family transcriptional regulator
MTTSSSERRTAILRAATRLFEHYGHGKTTIADVAREAQVGVGTVYLEFESKEAIVQELSLSTHVGVLDSMRAASEACPDHASRLSAVLEARTRCFLELRRKGQHACELVHCKTEGVRAAHQRFKEQELALFASIVREGQRAGAFAAGEPVMVAALVQRAFVSLAPPQIFGSDDDATRASADLCSLLLHGLLVKSEAATRSSAGRAGSGAHAHGKQSGAPGPRARRAR